MDGHVLNLAIPQLSADLRPTNVQLLWIVDSYAFLVAGSLMTMGVLGDRIGRRRLLLIGAAAFGCASLLAAFSASAPMLIAARALLGVAGATLMPSTLSLIRNMFRDPRQRTTAFGIWTASFALGGVIAPIVAGVLLHWFWWGSVFLVAVPVMVALLALGPVLLPEFRDPDAARIDLVSAALSLIVVLSAVFGFKRAAQDGPDAAAGLAIAMGSLWRRCSCAASSAARSLDRPRAVPAPQLHAAARDERDELLRPLRHGALHRPVPAVGARPLTVARRAVDDPVGLGLPGGVCARADGGESGPSRWLLGASLALTAVGFGLLTQVGPASGLAVVVCGSIVFSIGLAPVYVVATGMILAAAPPERAGAASAILETGAELGGAVGIAFLGSLGGAVYRHAMTVSGASGVPDGLWERARRTLGGAVDASTRLAEPVDAELLGSARDAFTLAFRTVEGVGAAVMAALAVAAVLLLRRP